MFCLSKTVLTWYRSIKKISGMCFQGEILTVSFGREPKTMVPMITWALHCNKKESDIWGANDYLSSSLSWKESDIWGTVVVFCLLQPVSPTWLRSGLGSGVGIIKIVYNCSTDYSTFPWWGRSLFCGELLVDNSLVVKVVHPIHTEARRRRDHFMANLWQLC